MPSRSLVRLAPIFFVLAAAPAGAAETLRWKFSEGDTHHYELNQTTVTTATVGDQEVKTSILQTVEMGWEVVSVEDDGSARMAQTIERVKVALESQFANFSYDSADEGAAEGPAEALKPVVDALVGARVVLVMTPRGEVEDVEVPDEMIERLRNAGPAAQALQNLASAEGMKGLIGQSSLILPDEDVEQGSTWTRQVELPTPQGTLAMTNTFTIDALESAAANIGMAMKIDEFKTDPNAEFEMTVADQDGSGTFAFDTEAGRLESSEVKQMLKAEVSAQGQQVTSISESTATFTRTGD